MEGLEQNNLQDTEQNANAGIAGAENPGQNNEGQPQLTQEDHVREWFKSQGREVADLNEVLTPVEKIVEKEVNPYADILDEEDKAYLNYKKDTGRSRKDFESLKTNWDNADHRQLAREKVRKDNALPNLSDAEADEYLAETLGVDFNEFDTVSKVKLAGFVKDVINEKKAEQEKYKLPAENKNAPQQQGPEMVTLENGAVLLKSTYEKLVADQQKHIEEAKQAVNSVTAAGFKVSIDDNGSPRELDYSYDYAEQDVQHMAAIVSDVNGVMNSRYSSENGFNHAQFAQDLWWSDQKNREKAISALLSTARAEAIEEIMKTKGNHNFTPTLPQHKQQKDGVRMMSISDIAKL